MNIFSVSTADFASGNAAYKTMIGIIAANTAGYRGRVRKLILAAGGEAPQDVNVDWRLITTNNATAGTPGSSPTPTQLDNNSRASIMTAGVAYSAEPTTLAGTSMLQGAFNGRGGLVLDFGIDDSPKWGIQQTLCLQISGATAAVKCTGTIEYEEW